MKWEKDYVGQSYQDIVKYYLDIGIAIFTIMGFTS